MKYVRIPLIMLTTLKLEQPNLAWSFAVGRELL